MRFHPISLCKRHLLTTLASVLGTTATVSQRQGFASAISLPDPRALSERFPRHRGSSPWKMGARSHTKKAIQGRPQGEKSLLKLGDPFASWFPIPHQNRRSRGPGKISLKSYRPAFFKCLRGQQDRKHILSLPACPIQFSTVWAWLLHPPPCPFPRGYK